jgi:hypothetical protein
LRRVCPCTRKPLWRRRVLSSDLTSLKAGKMVANEPTAWMGLTERLYIYATMLWMAVMAIGLLRAE